MNFLGSARRPLTSGRTVVLLGPVAVQDFLMLVPACLSLHQLACSPFTPHLFSLTVTMMVPAQALVGFGAGFMNVW